MKKVLIITYYWPPAGGPGVQRWLKFTKYLRDFEIEPFVYVPANPTYPIIDHSLKKEIPEGIRILKKRIFEPYSLARIVSKKNTKTISSGIITGEEKQSFLQKIMLYIRGNFFIPDARRFWVKPSAKFLQEFLIKEEIDTIITTGPPHSIHLIGLQLKSKLNLTWIADFRDPWTEIGYHSKLRLNQRSKEKHRRLEKEVLEKSDHLITTSFTTKKEFAKKSATPVSVITNGFDEIDFERNIAPGKQFSFSHIGSLLSGRNPENLWKVLGELVRENKDFAEDFQLQLVGAVSTEVVESIRESGLRDHLIIKGYVGHPEAIKMQARSQVLLLIEIESEATRGIIPGKLFEYMASRRPILAVGPAEWDVKKIISETKAGQVFGYSEKQEMKKYILELYGLYKTKTLESDAKGIAEYSRRNLTAKLATLLKQK